MHKGANNSYISECDECVYKDKCVNTMTFKCPLIDYLINIELEKENKKC